MVKVTRKSTGRDRNETFCKVEGSTRKCGVRERPVAPEARELPSEEAPGETSLTSVNRSADIFHFFWIASMEVVSLLGSGSMLVTSTFTSRRNNSPSQREHARIRG